MRDKPSFEASATFSASRLVQPLKAGRSAVGLLATLLAITGVSGEASAQSRVPSNDYVSAQWSDYNEQQSALYDANNDEVRLQWQTQLMDQWFLAVDWTQMRHQGLPSLSGLHVDPMYPRMGSEQDTVWIGLGYALPLYDHLNLDVIGFGGRTEWEYTKPTQVMWPDGYVESRFVKDMRRFNVLGGQLKLRWQLTSDLELYAMTDYQRAQQQRSVAEHRVSAGLSYQMLGSLALTLEMGDSDQLGNWFGVGARYYFDD